MTRKKESSDLPPLTLGWELEATHHARRRLEGISLDHDGSVNGESLEYKIKRSWAFEPTKSIQALRELTTDPFLRTDGSCGFHVHIGLGTRTRKLPHWAAWFVTLAREVERDAFEAVPESRRQNRYCRSWKSGSNDSIIKKQYSGAKYSNGDRYQWVNPVEVFRPGGIRTIEVRLMGGTHRYTYLLAWTSVCRLMAMSAWALVHDPSRLEFEKQETKKAFKLIRDVYQVSSTTKETARVAVYLANKAGLVAPFGQPLAKLKTTEKTIEHASWVTEQEQRKLESVMREMRRVYRAGATLHAERERAGDTAIHAGDNVECIHRPSDGGLTVGHLYRVIAAGSEGIEVYNDNGSRWYVDNNCVRLHGRSVTAPVAVPVSA